MSSRTYSIMSYERFTGQTGKRFRREIETRPKGDPLREAYKDAQYLADVLLCNPNANMYGLYYITPAMMRELTGLLREEIDVALRILRDDSFAYWDEATDMVWVREMARIQMYLPLKPGNTLVKPVNQWYKSCRRNPFLGPFFDRYAGDLRLEARRDEMQERMPTLPLEPAPGAAVDRRGVDRQGPSPTHQWFLIFLEAYPAARRVGGPSGFQAFARALRGKADPEAHVQLMLDALWEQSRSEQWRGGVVPAMTKWLDEEHWVREMRVGRSQVGLARERFDCEHDCANAGEHALRVKLDEFCQHDPRCVTFIDHYRKEAEAV